MQKTKSGFTIVELLIVIVVIAILAAISIVAYNGIQSRARNVQQLSTAKTYLNVFASYVVQNNSYPPYSRSRTCLNIDQADCVNNTAWNRDTTLENALKTIATTSAQASTNILTVGTPKMGYVPVVGSSDLTLDGVSNPFLIYTLESPATCTSGTPASGVWPNFTSNVPAQGYTSNETNGIRVCMIPLPRI